MIVTWLPSNGTVWRMPGSSFYLNYTLEGFFYFLGPGVYQQSNEIFLPTTETKIEGLTDSSKYLLAGMAKDGPGISYSQPIPVFTQQKENTSHLNQGRLFSLFVLIFIQNHCELQPGSWLFFWPWLWPSLSSP